LKGDSKFVLDVNPAQDLVLTLNVPGFLPTKWAIKTAYVSLDDERPTSQNNLFFDETLELLPDSHSGNHYSYYSSILFNELKYFQSFLLARYLLLICFQGICCM
jgi:hypothetical protein